MKAHIRKTCPSALCWKPENLPALNEVCRELGIRLVQAVEADLEKSLGQLLELPGRYPAGLTVPKGDFAPALILHGLADAELDKCLALLRKKDLSIPLKAIVTDTNSQWPLAVVLQELSEERAAFEAGK